MEQIPLITLNNGVRMPALGFGTFAKDNVPEKCYDAVLHALNAGYRHLDCASYYQNEAEVGKALKQWLSDNPNYQRSDIFITSKVWPHLMEPQDVKWSVNKSLADLGVDYLDALLIHWPFAVERTDDYKVKLDAKGKHILKPGLTANLSRTWSVFETLYHAGTARSIGVSNYRIADLKELLTHANVIPAMNQVELHPFLPSTILLDYMARHSIVPVAYSPLGSQNQCTISGEKLLDNKIINDIAKNKSVDVAQVLISWGIGKGWGVLPKSSDRERIARNFQLIDLTALEKQRLDRLADEWGGERRFVNPLDIFGFGFFEADEQAALA